MKENLFLSPILRSGQMLRMVINHHLASLLIVPLRTASNFFNEWKNCNWRELWLPV